MYQSLDFLVDDMIRLAQTHHWSIPMIDCNDESYHCELKMIWVKILEPDEIKMGWIWAGIGVGRVRWGLTKGQEFVTFTKSSFTWIFSILNKIITIGVFSKLGHFGSFLSFFSKILKNRCLQCKWFHFRPLLGLHMQQFLVDRDRLQMICWRTKCTPGTFCRQYPMDQ